MKNKLAGINYRAGFVTVSTWKFEKLDDLKKKEDIVIKNKKFYVNYLECHVIKIIGDRNLIKKYTMTKTVDVTKNKKKEKNMYRMWQMMFFMYLIFLGFLYNVGTKITKINEF